MSTAETIFKPDFSDKSMYNQNNMKLHNLAYYRRYLTQMQCLT